MVESTSLETHGVSAPVDEPAIAELGGDAKLNRGGLSWSIFQGGRDPYVILITIYIFLPYVSSVLVGDPIHGQEVVSQYAQTAGWIVTRAWFRMFFAEAGDGELSPAQAAAFLAAHPPRIDPPSEG